MSKLSSKRWEYLKNLKPDAGVLLVEKQRTSIHWLKRYGKAVISGKIKSYYRTNSKGERKRRNDGSLLRPFHVEMLQ